MTDKKNILFNFTHHYLKLDKDKFTTIRSVKYDKKHPNVRMGAEGMITLKNEDFCMVKILRWVDKQIYDIPLSLLQFDGDTEEKKITSHWDFIDLLNSFIPYKSNQMATTKRIYFLEKIKRNGES